MAKIKHIALATPDVERTARFYIEVFGLKAVGTIDDPGTRGYFLSDGEINLAILHFKNDAAAGVERGKDWSGLHHIGFHVESLEAIAERLAQAGARHREDVERALGVGGRQPHGNVEVKYTGPDGVMLDVSETGWVGTQGFGA
jgi:glyoxylase I family protein